MRKRILYLCTGNSCRSQMAEGWTRALWSNEFEAYSAGTVARGLDARAVAVMAEAGVDISEQESKTVADLADLEFDLVVTVCSDADRTCPAYPGRVTKLHRGFDDPPKLAAHAVSEEQALSHYRRVRDEIRAFAASLPDILAALPLSSQR
jgi:arsenate reductase